MRSCAAISEASLAGLGRGCESPPYPDSGRSGGKVCSTPSCHVDRITPYADGCCFSCPVIFSCAWLLLLNSNLQNMQSSFPTLCGRTIALKQS